METDIRGNALEVGARVAFNCSGAVHLGTIVQIKDLNRYGRPYKQYVIRSEMGYANSKVNNKDGMVVIFEEE